MSFYRVTLSQTYSDVFFDFLDYGEAMGFVGTALENGHKNDRKLTAEVWIEDEEANDNE